MESREESPPNLMSQDETSQDPIDIIEEIEVEVLTVDGICGVY
jgi:hypothetical protein